MRIKDPLSEPEEPFNLVPLTDMVFNLLIFFMAATTFAQVEKEIGIHLPKASSFTALSTPPQQMVINIDEHGKAIVRHKEYDDSGLTQMVLAMVRQNKDSSVVIRADKRGTVEHFASVINDCKQAGVQEAKIIYLGEGAAK
jgi:biopolymer transport protein ExbD